MRLRNVIVESGVSWRWLALALAIRICLSPLQHTWDSQTWWNALAQIGADPNPLHAVSAPFESMREMSDLAHGSGHELYYEYWAYPPGMLFVWWPVARIWTLLVGPLTPQFAGPDTFTAVPFPFLLSLGMKFPIMIADLIAALLVARLAGPAVARWYLFNPYILLVCFWTFDPVMLAFLLGGLLAAERERWMLSGVLLGLGAAVKFVPGLLVIAVALWAVRRSSTPFRSALLAVAAAAGAFFLISLPAWDGVWYALQFHSGRPGGGMSWQSIWGTLGWLRPLLDLRFVHLSLSAEIGSLTLTGALLFAAWLCWMRKLDLLETSLVLMLAYLVGSKLVNEVYPLPAVALAAIAAARRASANTDNLLVILWALPLLFAAVNVPAWGFLVSPAETLGLLTPAAARAFYNGYALTYQQLAPALLALGVAFQIACIWGIWHIVKPGSQGSFASAAVSYAA